MTCNASPLNSSINQNNKYEYQHTLKSQKLCGVLKSVHVPSMRSILLINTGMTLITSLSVFLPQMSIEHLLYARFTSVLSSALLSFESLSCRPTLFVPAEPWYLYMLSLHQDRITISGDLATNDLSMKVKSPRIRI